MKLFLFSTFLLFSSITFSQVGIGNTNPTATLDITAANPTGLTTNVDGLLIPRVTRERAQSMTSVPTSAMIYINEVITGTASGTTVNVTAVGLYYFNGTAWEKLVTGASSGGWSITGNSGIVDGTNYIGTDGSTNVDLAFRRNNLAAGKIAATSTSFGLGALNSGAATNCTAFGISALTTNSTGTGNSAFGTNALRLNSTGTNNTAIGATAVPANPNNAALGANTTGINNTAIGAGALAANTATSNNTAIGSQALAANVSPFAGAAEYNTAIGSSALLANTTGRYNAALGASALLANTTGSSNVALGYLAGSNITIGASSNIMIGANTLAPVATASSQLNIGNTIFGNMAGALTSGVNTTRTIGINVLTPQAALDITSTNNGVLIPRIALVSSTDISIITSPVTSLLVYNTGLGGLSPAGYYYWDGSSWVRFVTGAQAGWSTTGNSGLTAGTNFMGTTDNVDVSFKRSNTAAGFIGATNTAFGVSSLAANSGTNNTAFGTSALAANNSPGDNTAFGYFALKANTLNSGAGNLNTAVGSSALAALNGGARNTAVGASALAGVNDNASLDNVAVGWNALPGVGTITQSTAIGSGALSGSGSGSTRNTAIGYNAGNAISTSIDNVIIGWSAQGSGATARNQIVIGAGASANADNTVTLGNGSITTLRCAATSITSLSDRRDKANIVTLTEGIEFIKKLKPVTYTWNTRDKSKVGVKAAGFIAQDLLELQQNSAIGENLDLVTYNNPNRLEARYGNLLPVIVKGIQEQQEEIEALRKANAELIKTNEAIMKRLEALENKK